MHLKVMVKMVMM